jgi:hypothetical protein
VESANENSALRETLGLSAEVGRGRVRRSALTASRHHGNARANAANFTSTRMLLRPVRRD